MANVELEFIACTACTHPSAPPFLLFTCHPLRKSAIPSKFCGDTEGKNSYFSSVFP